MWDSRARPEDLNAAARRQSRTLLRGLRLYPFLILLFPPPPGNVQPVPFRMVYARSITLRFQTLCCRHSCYSPLPSLLLPTISRHPREYRQGGRNTQGAIEIRNQKNIIPRHADRRYRKKTSRRREMCTFLFMIARMCVRTLREKNT